MGLVDNVAFDMNGMLSSVDDVAFDMAFDVGVLFSSVGRIVSCSSSG